MNCTKCGARLLDTASFCTTCGTPVPKSQPTPVPTPAQNPWAAMFDITARRSVIYADRAANGPVDYGTCGEANALFASVLDSFVVNDIPLSKAGFIKDLYIYKVARKIDDFLYERWANASNEGDLALLYADLDLYCAGKIEGLFPVIKDGCGPYEPISPATVSYLKKYPPVLDYLNDIALLWLVYNLNKLNDETQSVFDHLCEKLNPDTVLTVFKRLNEMLAKKDNPEQ